MEKKRDSNNIPTNSLIIYVIYVDSISYKQVYDHYSLLTTKRISSTVWINIHIYTSGLRSFVSYHLV